jgi:WD40 repeat protein/tRNA A-37 threonylcarbamoyl transferase component Bud32
MDFCLGGAEAVEAARKPGLSSSAPLATNRAEPPLVPLVDRSFGDYELIEEIARGGMGVVYKARQKSLDRIVALKMVLGGSLASQAAHQRFLAEAQTGAGLQHPNIVAIHEVGDHAGQPFFSMDYVQGRNLAEVLRDGPLAPRRAAGYAKTIAEAVAYAHQRGILHRDLKPSNVLIDQSDQLRITDFGLAKRLTGESDLTVSGQVLGSPNFMAPEQAQGRHAEIGPPSDVYSIGALLYHLLTGRPPFQAATLTEVLRQVVTTEPAGPRLLNPSLPRDLETICLKCLEKDISRRYPTGQALADELGRFLRGEPILARPLGRAGKVVKWCRRNPRLVSAIGVAALILLVGLLGVLSEWRRADAQRARAEADEYVFAMYSAQQALKANNPGRARELLNRYRPESQAKVQGPKSKADPRGFEWRYLWPQCQSDAEKVIGKLPSWIRSLEISGDGQWLFAGPQGGEPKLWNLPTDEQLPIAGEADWAFGVFSPDSRLLLVTAQTAQLHDRISVWDLQARKQLEPILEPRPVFPMTFSADGRWFAYGVHHPPWGRHAVVLDFSTPTRKKVWEVAALTGIQDLYKGTSVVFTRDSRSLIFSEVDPDGRICLFDLASGELQHFPGHREAITAMALSPDGQILATGAGYTDTEIKLWEVPSFRPLPGLSGHRGWITGLSFSPDGRTLASAGADQTWRLWEVPTQKPGRVFGGLPSDVMRLRFSPDGQKLFTGSRDGTIQRWSLATPPSEPQPSVRRKLAGLQGLVMAPDARRCAALQEGEVCLGEVQGETPPSRLQELGTNNTCLLFSSDGQSLFAGTQSGEVQVWSLGRRQLVQRLRGTNEKVQLMRQDPQGRVLVVAQFSGPYTPVQIGVWGTAEWRRQGSWSVGERAGYLVATDGRWLAINKGTRAIQVWSLSDPPQTNRLSFPGDTLDLAFSPDGRLLAAANGAGAVKVWEVPNFRVSKEFQAHARPLSALAFFPDSRRLATAGDGDEAIKLWDVVTWQELITLPHEKETLEALRFTADGNQLWANNSQGDFLCWRAPSFTEIEAKEKERGTR